MLMARMLISFVINWPKLCGRPWIACVSVVCCCGACVVVVGSAVCCCGKMRALMDWSSRWRSVMRENNARVCSDWFWSGKNVLPTVPWGIVWVLSLGGALLMVQDGVLSGDGMKTTPNEGVLSRFGE